MEKKITNKDNELKILRVCYQTKTYLLKESNTFKIIKIMNPKNIEILNS